MAFPWQDPCDRGSHAPDVTYLEFEGFMGSEVGVAKLCDGNVYFLIPVQDIPQVIIQLQEIITLPESV